MTYEKTRLYFPLIDSADYPIDFLPTASSRLQLTILICHLFIRAN